MMARWTRRLGILTIVLAFIAGLTAWILYETDQTARESQRAAVFVKSVDIRLNKSIAGGVPVFRLIANWANGGTTGTRDLEFRQGCASRVEFGKDLRWKDFFNTHKVAWEKTFIGPQATQQIHVCGGVASYYLANMLAPSDKGLFMVGESRYFDVYGRRHYMSVCYRGFVVSNDENGVVMSVCPEAEARFNCADTKECEDQQ
jgi:hypothetical protein